MEPPIVNPADVFDLADASDQLAQRHALPEALAEREGNVVALVSNGILTDLAAIFATRAIGSLLGVEEPGAAGAGAEGAGIAVEKGTEAGVGAPLGHLNPKTHSA